MAPKRPDCGTSTASQRLCSLSRFIPYATGRNATDITERCLGSRLTNGKPARGNESSHNNVTRYTDGADITFLQYYCGKCIKLRVYLIKLLK
jgi:hypothetical protein